MRRAIFAVTGLAATTTLLVVLKGGDGASRVAQTAPSARPGESVAPTPAGVEPPPSTQPGSPGPGAATATPSARSTSKAPGTRSTTRPPSAPRTTPPAPKPPTGPYKVTGPVVENEYGLVQVQITMSGSRISNVVALELPQETADSDRRSETVDDRYSGTSGQAVQRQSADLDTVSGATTTSGSYKRSLQAAIDAARRGQRD